MQVEVQVQAEVQLWMQVQKLFRSVWLFGFLAFPPDPSQRVKLRMESRIPNPTKTFSVDDVQPLDRHLNFG